MTYRIILATKDIRQTLKTPFEIKFFNDEYINIGSPWRNDREYLVAVDDANQVLGVMCFNSLSGVSKQISPKRALVGFAYLSISSFHKHKGIGKALAASLFEYAKQIKRGVRLTEYEADGEMYLKPIIKKLAVEHPYSVFETYTKIN